MDSVEDEFMDSLRKKVSGLKEVYSSEQCQAMLFFCPIVSRAGTDIDAAMKHLDQFPCLSVPIIMVILHSTFDPERIIPDSNNAIQRENTLAVDCLIFDNKLLRCQKNDNAIVQTAHLFKSKKVTSYYCLNYHGDRKLFIDQKATKVSRASLYFNLIFSKKHFVLSK
ncbi:hypothetical protein F2P79_006874 [Pimephales promelas]|nr:hypothetical protein F2P79_006874 [Pimephales promelas]